MSRRAASGRAPKSSALACLRVDGAEVAVKGLAPVRLSLVRPDDLRRQLPVSTNVHALQFAKPADSDLAES